MVEVSFSVYNVNVILYFGIWLCFIDLEFLTHLGLKSNVEMCIPLFSKIFRSKYSFRWTTRSLGSVSESKRTIIIVVFKFILPLLKERERKEKNLNSHSCNIYLQLSDIYIYKARSPNYHTCDLY